MNPDHYITLSAILFTIGTVGFMTRRNAMVAFMCVELPAPESEASDPRIPGQTSFR